MLAKQVLSLGWGAWLVLGLMGCGDELALHESNPAGAGGTLSALPPTRPDEPVLRVPVDRLRSDLDAVARSQPRSRLDLSEAQLDSIEKSLDSVGLNLEAADRSMKSLKVQARLDRLMAPPQRELSSRLLGELNKQVQSGALKIQRGSNGDFLLTDGSRQQLELGNPPQNPGSVGLDAIEPEHAGTGTAWVKWSWKWWGVKVRFSHKAAWYLCQFTTWTVNQLSLASWVKTIIKTVACLLHNLDSDNDGLTINITWAGVFWLNDSSM